MVRPGASLGGGAMVSGGRRGAVGPVAPSPQPRIYTCGDSSYRWKPSWPDGGHFLVARGGLLNRRSHLDCGTACWRWRHIPTASHRVTNTYLICAREIKSCHPNELGCQAVLQETHKSSIGEAPMS